MPIRREFLSAGRLSRSGFWWRHALGLPPAMFLCIAADTLIGRPLGLLTAAATTAFLVSVWARRLHDRGHSAWWLLVGAVPVLGFLALLIECGLRGSEAAPNRFGPLPSPRHDYLSV